MEYICHKRFRGESLGCGAVNIPYGSRFSTIGNFIATASGQAIVSTGSLNCYRHFARNDDGQGLRRGKLAYAIAYGNRQGKGGYRFSDDEIRMLKRDYCKFLQETETILFNHDFFNADIKELETLAEKLSIRIKED